MKGFGDFRLSAAGHGAGFVAEKAFADGADQAPFAVVYALAHFHLVSAGQHVHLTRADLQKTG